MIVIIYLLAGIYLNTTSRKVFFAKSWMRGLDAFRILTKAYSLALVWI